MNLLTSSPLDIVTLTILAFMLLCVVAGLFFLLLRKYDIAVGLIAMSPWISAGYASVFSKDTIEVEAGLASYIRVSVLLLTGCIGAIKYLQYQSIHYRKIPLHIKLLCFFLVGALVSTTYSIDPFYTFVRSASFIALFCFLLGLNFWIGDEYQKLNQVVNALFYMVIIITAANTLSPLALGERAWLLPQGRFSGLWDHPNTMGAFCTISYPVLFWKYREFKSHKKWFIVLLTGALLSMHVLTGSRTSLLASILGVAIWFLMLKQIRNVFIFFSVLVLLAIVFSFSPAVNKRFIRTSEYSSNTSMTTFTGRTDFWVGCLDLIKESPLLGYGFGVEGKVWDDPRFYNEDQRLWIGSSRSSLHNGYLSVAIGMGGFFFIIWCVLLVIPLYQCKNSNLLNYKAFVVTIMTMCLIVNLVETQITGGNSVVAVFFWIAWVIAGKIGSKEFMIYPFNPKPGFT